MATLTAAVYAEDGGFVARCLDNNVVSQGDTVEEALRNLHEALELYYDDATPPETSIVAVNTLTIKGHSRI